jgi:hypothetical protein
MTSFFGMGSHQATLEEDVTLFNGPNLFESHWSNQWLTSRTVTENTESEVRAGCNTFAPCGVLRVGLK